MNPRFSGHLTFLAILCLAAHGFGQTNGSTKPKLPVATVDGQAIYEDDLLPTIQGQILPLKNQEYDIERKALDSVIDQKLLEGTAKKKGMTVDQLLAAEVDSKVADPSDAEVEGYYMALRERVKGNFEDVKSQLKDSLKQAQIQQAHQEYVKKLRTSSNVAILISAPRIDVAYDRSRVRGNPSAPVMIIEFSDYQCPYCHQVEPTLKQVLAKYGDKVSFAYRDFPLSQMHAQAEIAAEASRCAEEQGKFWEYHDQLFATGKLEKDALVQYAKDLNLDDQKFTACLSSEKYKADIQKDVTEGRKAGVTGTPGFFINGITLEGAKQQESFTKIIDDELSRSH